MCYAWTIERWILFQVVTDIERNDVDFIARTLHLQPIAHIDHFSADKLGSAGLAQEVTIAGSNSKVPAILLSEQVSVLETTLLMYVGIQVVKFTEIANMGRTVTILMRGSNRLVLDEADR